MPGNRREWATTSIPGDQLFGRERELATVERCFDGPTQALLLAGEPGIGKTALWRAAAELARVRGWRVLAAAPASPERHVSFAGLGDLLTDVLGETAEKLPAPQRRALEIALTLRPSEARPPDQHAVALASLAVLRIVATQQPVLVAVDDVQWLDRPTETVLAFALRRLVDARLRVVVSCRTGRLRTGLPLGLDAGRFSRLDVGPLTFGAMHRLLIGAQGESASYPVARRLHESAHGNPLHALELARSLERRWPWTPGSFSPPPDLADLVRARVAGLPDGAQRALLLVSAMAQPTLDLLDRAERANASRDVDRAVRAGLLRVEGTRLRFAHPLFASACYRSATEAQRRAAHSALAEVVSDPERRARHLAMSAVGPDEGVALALDVGARHARARGAPGAAAELADLARGLTPPTDPETRARRTRAVAGYLLEAGESTLARNVLETQLADAPAGPARARTLAALTAVLFEAEGLGAARAAAQQAVDEAGDDSVALTEAHLAVATHAQLPAAETLEHVESALRILDAGQQADPDLEARVLREVALARYHLGQGMPRDLVARATAAEASLDQPPPVAWRARTCMGECLKYLDRFDEADDILTDAALVAEREGDASSFADIAGHRAELALWLGRWSQADEQANRAVEVARLSGQHGRLGVATYFRSLVNAHLGRVGPARADAESALETATGSDDAWGVSLARSALGFLELSRGESAAAAEQLDEVDRLAGEALMTVPRQWRYLGDYVEVLVACGELDRAADRLDALRAWSSRVDLDSARAACFRAAGVLQDATGDRAAALRSLETAVATHQTLRLPFEHGRSLLALGAARRRMRRRREARESLKEALQIFVGLGAELWAGRAAAELERISGRSGAATGLTASEQRVAELVCRGLSNKQVAAALVVTPRTVEAHLTRIYTKYGVHSRLELVRRLRPPA